MHTPNTAPAQNPIRKFFTDHPSTVDETYFQHMRFAARFAARLFLAGSAAIIHAIFPAFCETTASDQIKAMHAEITNRHAQG